ncbi:(2Fe-2S)-binding protein [Hanstruepera ponticola]|uniref:(2Fe-2S)-binding protein n=1 Tax=Hanstruepera ponticola TaxID=2042995 RepID=UPI001783E020|nr:(2Fe-2S)-binding protein [Hanstruepera ponticola]
MSHSKNENTFSRRFFIKTSSAFTALALVPHSIKAFYNDIKETYFTKKVVLPIYLKINGKDYNLNADSRTTLLDLLRENLNLTGTKKGCDHGQCGACTVHINGQRALSCLSLAAMMQGKEITTIEGLANGDNLHPMQEAFLEHDGYQCGYCTPGQIMSAVACVNEGHTKSIEEIKEYMSGNICRCGAYNGITNAIKSVAK